jgi:hypothetical protein
MYCHCTGLGTGFFDGFGTSVGSGTSKGLEVGFWGGFFLTIWQAPTRPEQAKRTAKKQEDRFVFMGPL